MRASTETLSAAVPAFLQPSSEAEVRRLNTLIGEHREFAFIWAGKPARLRFVSPARAPRPTGWLRVQLNDRSFDMGLPELPEPASLGAAFAGIEIALLPEELLLGALETWLEEPIAVLQQQGISLQLANWQTSEGPATASCGWELSWDGHARFLAGTLNAEEEALNFLTGLAHRVPPTTLREADTVAVAVSVALAHLPLEIETVRSMTTGDVLLLPLAKAALAQGQCELWAGDRRLGRAIKHQQTVRILSMNPSSEARTATSVVGALPVDQLPVQLVFDVGQIELSIGQLRTLAEGYTFELPAAPERLVTIRANGREIGQGELVDLGEKIGVRIATWSLA